MGSSRRLLAGGLALAALAAGVVLAVVLAGSDDGGGGNDKSANAPATKTRASTPSATEKPKTEPAAKPTPVVKHDQRQIAQAVATFVDSWEQGDSQRACSQVAGGSGKPLPSCATAAGIDVMDLPSSEELQIDRVDVSGDSAKAGLSNGSTFTLEQTGGRWKLTGFKAGAVG